MSDTQPRNFADKVFDALPKGVRDRIYDRVVHSELERIRNAGKPLDDNIITRSEWFGDATATANQLIDADAAIYEREQREALEHRDTHNDWTELMAETRDTYLSPDDWPSAGATKGDAYDQASKLSGPFLKVMEGAKEAAREALEGKHTKQEQGMSIDSSHGHQQEREKQRELADNQWKTRIAQGQAIAAAKAQETEQAKGKKTTDEEKDISGREV